MMNAFEFLLHWYKKNCNGDWEHQYGVRINTIDNPGWQVKIDLVETDMENVEIEYHLVEKNESDWYGYSVKNNVYSAAGDPDKLENLLDKFKEIAGQ